VFWAWVSLSLYIVFAFTVFAFRSFIQYRRTGASGIHVTKLRGMERVSAALIAPTKVAWLMAPVSVLLGWMSFIRMLDSPAVHVIGVVVAIAGIIMTSVSQFAMGNSWRVGIDSANRTPLITVGPFRWVRNPIYDGLLIFAAATVLIIPTWLAVISFILLIACIEVQVRCVEEPHLLREHGKAYRSWAAHTGRFIPFVGRL
jgi:protein-S-isoprenylcysteine O-methyltransferase Ste14